MDLAQPRDPWIHIDIKPGTVFTLRHRNEAEASEHTRYYLFADPEAYYPADPSRAAKVGENAMVLEVGFRRTALLWGRPLQAFKVLLCSGKIGWLFPQTKTFAESQIGSGGSALFQNFYLDRREVEE